MKKLFVTIILALLSLGIAIVWLITHVPDSDLTGYNNEYGAALTRTGSSGLSILLFPGLIETEIRYCGSKEDGDKYLATPTQTQYVRIEDVHIGSLDLGYFVFFRDASRYDVYYTIVVPCWAIFVAAIAYPAFRLGRRIIYRRKYNQFPHCKKCNYNLTGNESGYCPECGEITSGDVLSAEWQKWAKAPTIVEHASLLGISCYGILGVSDPAPWNESWFYLILGFLAGSVWIWLVYVYCVRIVTCWLSRRRDENNQQEPVQKRRWIVGACCVSLLISSMFYPWPLFLRFRLSQSAFDTALTDFRAGEFNGGSWVGLYYVHSVQDHPEDYLQTVLFRTGGTHDYPLGFEYDSDPEHYRLGYGAVQVSSFWYMFTEVW